MSEQKTTSLQSGGMEIIFWIEEAAEGDYLARAVGESIFTQADTLPELRELVKDAVHCHHPDPISRPKLIRLHIVNDVENHFGLEREALLKQLFD
ncbi:MAG: hypothetical protein NW220_09335 [Leptolyngbyaceae cyanobacterium bins.349]|nr:hypothetical protein [Leptolyngbyaceae cyanobacterium bins.349]